MEIVTRTVMHHGKTYDWKLYEKHAREYTPTVIIEDWNNIFRDAILRHVKNRGLVVQAGGWQGIYPRLLSEIFNVVYTFEPDPKNFHCLALNCATNNIFKFQAVLSDHSGIETFEEVNATGQGRVKQDTDFGIKPTEQYTVPSLTLDSFNLPMLDFMMIDVENYEYNVFRGAIETIQKFHPIILHENTSGNVENTHAEQISTMLTDMGYEVIENFKYDIMWEWKDG